MSYEMYFRRTKHDKLSLYHLPIFTLLCIRKNLNLNQAKQKMHLGFSRTFAEIMEREGLECDYTYQLSIFWPRKERKRAILPCVPNFLGKNLSVVIYRVAQKECNDFDP